MCVCKLSLAQGHLSSCSSLKLPHKCPFHLPPHMCVCVSVCSICRWSGPPQTLLCSTMPPWTVYLLLKRTWVWSSALGGVHVVSHHLLMSAQGQCKQWRCCPHLLQFLPVCLYLCAEYSNRLMRVMARFWIPAAGGYHWAGGARFNMAG